ncbi:SigE family RNA polymerase sigma factor [Actinocrispum wychmicini]|uniref:RNA polymerase sigma-70 factor (ECF subfamily) n=1 Tax=Actinocrispum wychmicini TaxID=1213861 RepID=A0A4R2JFM7_9PSEU|nr:SigE family RNA polymerase sigma factor [Actinocrispum wychmicini]TCO53055.1 RNA polymerase sigma-70 factor (ECF subfamily) [Actinocrispum wychmicini]
MTVEEFEEFYTHCVRRLTGQLYLVTGDLQEAQDVVQEAFVRAWTHRGKLRRDAGPEAWVRTTAGRLAISRWRKHTRALHAWRSLGRLQPPTAAGPRPDAVALADALQHLPARQRLAVVLFYVCDLTVEQIAHAAGMASGTVKTHLSRGRAALAPLLDDTLRTEDHGV